MKKRPLPLRKTRAPRPAGGSQPIMREQAAKVGDPAFDGWRVEGLDYPSFRLTLVARLINRLTAQTLSQDSDLSFAEWRVLCRLALAEGTTVRDIAEKAWVDRAEVSRAAARLEEAGLAARRSNPGDERMPILFATKAGKALYKSLIVARSHFYSAIIADLDESERSVLDKALGKMMVRLLAAARQS